MTQDQHHETDMREVLQRLTRIETEIKSLSVPSAEKCAVHGQQIKDIGKRMDKIESVVGKQGMISLTIGAVGYGLALLLKYLFTAGTVK